MLESHTPAGSWILPVEEAPLKHKLLIDLLDSCRYSGLNAADYHYDQLVNATSGDDYNALCTDALIGVCMDLFTGAHTGDIIEYDEISSLRNIADTAYIVQLLERINSVPDALRLVRELEPADKNYRILKQELSAQLSQGYERKIQELTVSLNHYRWMHHFHFTKFILVNIASGNLRFYQGDSLALSCEVVVGMPATRTPRMATWCSSVVLYPYWNVPYDIGVKELLPKCKRHLHSKELDEMQLVDKSGKTFELAEVDFSKYNRSNFPYTFRQVTGCDNALGVIKFELTDPFSVYLHDTNFKNAFLSARRYFSHGCIRVQQPLALGNLLTNNRIDSDFVRSCIHGQEPITIMLDQKVPVFVDYIPAVPSGDTVKYNSDVYHLFR